MAPQPSVLITGVSGNLGLRLVEQLTDFQVVGADLRPLQATAKLAQFEAIDLREERSCGQLRELMLRFRPRAVAHLAFDVRSCSLPPDERQRMWQANIAGMGRVVEAVAEHNRITGGIEKFIYPSSSWLYGPDTAKPSSEDSPLREQSFTYSAQKLEAEATLRARARSLGRCKIYILRAQTFAGANAHNFMIDLLRGTPSGQRPWGKRMRRHGRRLPLLLPNGDRTLEHRFQFVHLDDMARLMAYIIRRTASDRDLNILNVAGRGEPLSLRACLQEARLKSIRFPGTALLSSAQRLLCRLGISDIAPEAVFYAQGSFTVDTTRLRLFLGEDYRKVIQYTSDHALKDSFASSS